MLASRGVLCGLALAALLAAAPAAARAEVALDPVTTGDGNDYAPRWDFVVAGAVLWGGFYLGEILGSIDDGEADVYAIPFAGAWIAFAAHQRDGDLTMVSDAFSGVFQVTGFLMVVAGLVLPALLSREPTPDRASVAIAPWLGAGNAGLSLVGAY